MAEEQRKLAVAHMRSSLDDMFRKGDNVDDFSYKSPNENTNGELPPGWSQSEKPEGWRKWAQDHSPSEDDQHYWWRDNISPNHNLVSGPASLQRSSWPKKYEILPSWVENYPGFRASAWKVDEKQRTSTIVNLVTYVPLSPDVVEHPFAKIVFTEDDVPFKQMKNLCASVAKYNTDEVNLHGTFVSRPYTMGMDGKIRVKTGEFLPDSYLVHCAIDDIYLPYEDWRRFPDVESSDLVAKLTFAWKAVEEMQNEERSARIKNKIEDIRRSIKESQDKIADLERQQNEMYEKAADALNLLEEYGYDLTKIEAVQEKDLSARMELPTDLLAKLSRSLNLPRKSLNGYNNAQDQYALAP
jgi:hypothetical protein